MSSLLQRCRALEGKVSLESVQALLADGDISNAELAANAVFDARHPYGRAVFLRQPHIEGMLATWNRAWPCAPHDHGGSVGVVRVLRGRAQHRVFALVNGRLEVTKEERLERGDLLVVTSSLIHSMVDDGADEPLVTLHLYVDPIDGMLVYDMATRRTFCVIGDCGAWVPTDAPRLVQATYAGFQGFRNSSRG